MKTIGRIRNTADIFQTGILLGIFAIIFCGHETAAEKSIFTGNLQHVGVNKCDISIVTLC